MTRDDYDCVTGIMLDFQAYNAACKVLEVGENVNHSELKKAYRRASVRYHPDHNRADPDANKKFILVKCAYELLTEDKPCPALLEEINSWEVFPGDAKYKLDNPWGLFLWWRDKFFGSGENTESHKRTSCI
ncbi:MAG: DnaJ domain-containing protein [Desulforhopalus sp.]|nr:DnaJ domain-containing protein [Desulforhopalus sp.]